MHRTQACSWRHYRVNPDLSLTHSTVEGVNGRSADFVPGQLQLWERAYLVGLVVKLSVPCRNVTNVSVGDIVACVIRDDTRNAEASYISADGDAITMASGQIDPARVVRGQPVRDVNSRAGQRFGTPSVRTIAPTLVFSARSRACVATISRCRSCVLHDGALHPEVDCPVIGRHRGLDDVAVAQILRVFGLP